MPNGDDCAQDYLRCKSKCFDTLFQNLADAANDEGKIEEAKRKYAICKNLCKAAKAICLQTDD
jgi:hypothetical protein